MFVTPFGLLLLLIPGVLCSIADPCNPGQVALCATHLDHLGRHIAPLYTPTELDALCQNWTDAKPCFNEITAVCAEEEEGIFNETDIIVDVMIEKTASQWAHEWTLGYEYLCETGRSGYEMVHKCMTENVNLTDIAEECYQSYENETWYLDRKEPTNMYTFCSAAKDLVKCLKDEGEVYCGEEFAEWMWLYHNQLWLPHLLDIECNLESKFSPGALAIVTICGTAAVLAITLTIVSFIVKQPDPKKKKAATQKHNTVTSSVKTTGEDNRGYSKDKGDAIHDMNITKRINADAKSIEITQM